MRHSFKGIATRQLFRHVLYSFKKQEHFAIAFKTYEESAQVCVVLDESAQNIFLLLFYLILSIMCCQIDVLSLVCYQVKTRGSLKR